MTTLMIAHYNHAATYGVSGERHDVAQADFPPDLTDEVVRLAGEEVRSELWRFRLRDAEREEAVADVPVLFIPSKQRAAVVWDGRADWFDAQSPDAAMTEWLNRGMREQAASRSP